MTKHTPGPWKAVTSDEGVLMIDMRPQCKGYADIIEIGDLEDTAGEDHANAALIAAAPELLAALEAYVLHHNTESYEEGDATCECVLCRAANAAIDKAEGTQ